LDPGKLPSVARPQPGGKGVAVLTVVSGATVSARAGSAAAAETGRATASARRIRRMDTPIRSVARTPPSPAPRLAYTRPLSAPCAAARLWVPMAVIGFTSAHGRIVAIDLT